MGAETSARMTAAEVAGFLDEVFPQSTGMFVIEEVAHGRARVRMPVDESHLRPGDTISGPAMFWLADCAFYVAVLASIGPEAQAVTTNLSINFLRRPRLGELAGEARITKLGRRLASGDVLLAPAAGGEPVAQALVTYALPTGR